VALNEDYELNERFRGTGALVWYEATLRSGYLPRQSLRLLSRQYFRYGTVKGKWWARGRRPNARQVLLLLVPPAIGAVLVAQAARRRLGRTTILVLAAIAGVELTGGQGPAARTSGHLVGGAAIVCIGSSWWLGALAGFVGQRSESTGGSSLNAALEVVR